MSRTMSPYPSSPSFHSTRVGGCFSIGVCHVSRSVGLAHLLWNRTFNSCSSAHEAHTVMFPPLISVVSDIAKVNAMPLRCKGKYRPKHST
ncbi:hypothetical protein AVEN_213139-1 [Araneus ventricosus]|uniref:Uncharacterized protein n=1 Tax=Araneus ventricosus TaxID=182803 RepID=A0A4Y2R1T5_ARAVE|nr:hypothetical protein AVEN_213139-1 [Araneus ventricosus]